jgi:hypothetical protein
LLGKFDERVRGDHATEADICVTTGFRRRSWESKVKYDEEQTPREKPSHKLVKYGNECGRRENTAGHQSGEWIASE